MYCERMHVTANKLPCGEREECNGCQHSGGKIVSKSWKDGINSSYMIVEQARPAIRIQRNRWRHGA